MKNECTKCGAPTGEIWLYCPKCFDHKAKKLAGPMLTERRVIEWDYGVLRDHDGFCDLIEVYQLPDDPVGSLSYNKVCAFADSLEELEGSVKGMLEATQKKRIYILKDGQLQKERTS